MNKKTVLLSGLRSDSHTWNLAFLSLWFEERDFVVRNLGSCVPADEIAAACKLNPPVLVALSSVNGHGAQEGMEVLTLLRQGTATHSTPVVMGGKLTTSLETEQSEKSRLLESGFDGIFVGNSALIEFEAFLKAHGMLEVETLSISYAA